MQKADIGLIGLAVMGENLAINMLDKGYCVAVYNRTLAKVDAFVGTRAAGRAAIGCHSLEQLAQSLRAPRRVLLMIRAGQPVDEMIERLLGVLEPGDVIVDGGNSNFEDSMRRAEVVQRRGLVYADLGVSGGEEGALEGPSMMLGGSKAAWERVRDVFEAIGARAQGEPCCRRVGESGSGHYVKMIHNAIEYAQMQILCEAYHFMRDALGMSCEQMRNAFDQWNQGETASYLTQITRDILGYCDENGERTLAHILDVAGQKGTGKWAAMDALERGVALGTIDQAVSARFLTANRDERVRASALYARAAVPVEGERGQFAEKLRRAAYASCLVAYAQGFSLTRAAGARYGWNPDFAAIARMWRAGCILSGAVLEPIARAFEADADLANLLLNADIAATMRENESAWREVVAQAALSGIPAPVMGAALSYFDGYACASLPANLLQAQRDYFGAHGYERIDAPRGEFFHTNWTGAGGATAAQVYNV